MEHINIPIPIPKHRNLHFSKQVDQETIGELTKAIIDINEDDQMLTKLYEVYNLEYKPQPIKIYIDSYGGNVYQCFGLLSIMENSKTPIHTIVTGCAMSCGFMILICGHKRFGHKLSTPLYHQVSSYSHGSLKAIEEDLKETKRLQNLMEKITLKHTKILKEKLDKVYKRKIDWCMSAEEAKKNGVIDEII